MSRMRTFALMLATASAGLAGAISPVSAASPRIVEIVGEQDFGYSGAAGQLFDFKQGRVVVRRGDTVSWINKSVAPHTVSIIDAAEAPQTLKQVMDCKVCEGFFNAHAVNVGKNGPEPPFVAVLDTYKTSAANPPQLGNRGDSALIGPMSEPFPSTLGGSILDTFSAAITAPEGTTLNYVCAIHPWMQGTIQVIR